jgi:hypothetical protein
MLCLMIIFIFICEIEFKITEQLPVDMVQINFKESPQVSKL